MTHKTLRRAGGVPNKAASFRWPGGAGQRRSMTWIQELVERCGWDKQPAPDAHGPEFLGAHQLICRIAADAEDLGYLVHGKNEGVGARGHKACVLHNTTVNPIMVAIRRLMEKLGAGF